MTRAAIIRAWLLAQPGERGDGHLSAAFTTPQITKGISDDASKVGYTVNSMLRDGLLGRIGGGRTGRYYVTRLVGPRVKISAEERRRRKAAYEDNRRRMQGTMTIAEYLASKAAEREAKREATKERKEARKADKMLRLVRAKPKPKPKPVPKPPTKRILPKPVERPKPSQVAPQTVDEWMAAGNRPEVLPPGAWSTPLRFDL